MIIGAYAAAVDQPGDAGFAELLGLLGQDHRVTGLEVPSSHLLSPATAHHLFEKIPARWSSAITCFPGTMLNLLEDPLMGLASPDLSGRRKAVEQLAQIHQAVIRVNGTRPEPLPPISDVFLHSAPRGGTTEALLTSLEEVSSWDWGDCRLTLEHCDAAVDDHPAEKGFLSFEAELDALSGCTRPVGMSINWARSAIETRSPDGPAQHLERAGAGGILRWLIFSGVASCETSFGPAWADAHLPVDTVESASLLTEAQVRRALRHITSDTRLGLKVGLRPTSLSSAERMDRISACLDLVDRARSDTSADSGPPSIDGDLR